MIDKVEIHNFQSHKHTILEFVPGTNVIIGLSDTGKSAIFRAINWVLTNRPLGDAFRSDWGGDTHVILYLSDGNVVERLRSASKNEYLLNGEVLKAFGVDPPEPVLETLRMDPANIQTQADPPFLLSLSPGEAARTLNKAASLQEIDKTISNLKKSQLETVRQLEFQENQKEELEDRFTDFQDLPELEFRVEQLEQSQTEYEERNAQCEVLQNRIAKGRRVQSRLECTRDVPNQLQRLQQITDSYQDCQVRWKQTQNLQSMLERITLVQLGLQQTENIDKALADWDMAEQKCVEYVELEGTVNRLRKLVSQAKSVAASVQQNEGTLRKKEEAYHAIAPETCPLCEGAMQR